MATIPRSALDYVTRQVNSLSADAQDRVLRVLRSITWTPENIARCRDIVVEALWTVLPTYTDAAAQASADFYDAARELSVGETMGATAVSGYDLAATEGSVKAFVQSIIEGKAVEQFNRAVLGRVSYEVQRAAGYSVFANGRRDPLSVRYARVPSGSETCGFCIMLASRGFVYHSAETAGALNHYHDYCDCRIVPGWDTYDSGPSRRGSWSTSVEGYDPDALYDQYLALMQDGKISPSVGVPSSRNLVSASGETFRTKETMLRYVRDSGNTDELYRRVSEAFSAIDARYPERDPSDAKSEMARRNVYRANQRRRQYLSELYTAARGTHSSLTVA